MFKSLVKTIILITLISPVSACGPATIDVSPTVTNVPPSPIAVPPPATPTDVPPTNAPPTATPTDTPVPSTALSPTNTTGPDAPDSPGLTSLTGAYLGQNPPGASPVRFAPNILLPDGSWWWISPPKFSPDGREMVFTKYVNGNPDTKHFYAMQRMANDEWTSPQEVPFHAETESDDCHAAFSIDGSKLFFLSDRSGKQFFFVTKDDDRWSDPVPVNIPNLSGGWTLK